MYHFRSSIVISVEERRKYELVCRLPEGDKVMIKIKRPLRKNDGLMNQLVGDYAFSIIKLRIELFSDSEER